LSSTFDEYPGSRGVFLLYSRASHSANGDNRADAQTESSFIDVFAAFGLDEATTVAAAQAYASGGTRRKPDAAGEHAA